MTSFEERVLADLSELKTNMRWVVGDGTNGRLQELEGRVQKHEVFVQKAGGIGTLIAGLLTLLHISIDYLKLHHTP
jgi:hypothetical protein